MAFEWWCYSDPSNAVGHLTKRITYDRRKAERKAYRADKGCKGCARYVRELDACGAAQNPHKDGFCKWWWDDRVGTKPPEVK